MLTDIDQKRGTRLPERARAWMLAMAPILVLGAAADAPKAWSAEAAPQMTVSLTDTRSASASLHAQEVIAAEATSPKDLLIPVEGVAYSQLHDTFSDGRSRGRIHDAIDIMAPEGTPVVAVADGTIARMTRGARGGISIYQFDENQNFVYFYAHLRGYSPSLAEGQKIKRGDVIGYVGHTGNARARAPHLHLAIASVGADKRWWGGPTINPYPLFEK